MKRKQKEIDRQIKGLKRMKKRLPEHSSFGDKNWEKIDAQLDVLEGLEDADDFYQDETADEFEDGDNDVYYAAQQAEEWLSGEHEEDLFED